jgi:hypothetical protein
MPRQCADAKLAAQAQRWARRLLDAPVPRHIRLPEVLAAGEARIWLGALVDQAPDAPLDFLVLHYLNKPGGLRLHSGQSDSANAIHMVCSAFAQDKTVLAASLRKRFLPSEYWDAGLLRLLKLPQHAPPSPAQFVFLASLAQTTLMQINDVIDKLTLREASPLTAQFVREEAETKSTALLDTLMAHDMLTYLPSAPFVRWCKWMEANPRFFSSQSWISQAVFRRGLLDQVQSPEVPALELSVRRPSL